MPADTPVTAHITASTLMPAAIRGWQIYLNDQGRSNHTVKAFLGDVNLLANHLPPDLSIGNVSTKDINHFLQWLQNGRGVPCSPKSLARRITSIKAFFRWLHQSGRISADPAEKVLQQSVISPLPEVLTTQEQEALLQAARALRTGKKPDARPYTLLALLLTTGIKKGESLLINLNHIDLEAKDGPVLFVRYPGTRNRYKERKIDLTQDWLEAYREYVDQYNPKDTIFPWSPRRLEYLLEEIGGLAGLTKHLSFDMCRWSCALRDWRSDMEREAIRQKLGISKIQWREISMKLRQLAGEA